MKRSLAFYKVDNSLGYERHTFDDIYDDPYRIQEMLFKLPNDECRIYDLSTNLNGAGMFLDLSDLIDDYNDEELDGGWWSVLLEFPD